MQDRGHHPGLDGVRGLAILLVLGQHAPTRPLIDGWVGVTVFFCLSGYLITTLLVQELDGGTINMPSFYRRRAARLVPALLTVVAVTLLVLPIFRRDLTAAQILAPAGAAAAYATNFFDWAGHVFVASDYFNYTWTLSIEEQFYLLWPLSLLLGYRRNRRLFTALTVSLLVTSLTINLYLGLSRKVIFDQHEYFGTDTNALPILAGAFLAIVIHNDWLPRTIRCLAPWALPAVILLPVLAYVNNTERVSLVYVVGTVLTLVTLIGVETRPRSAARSLLASSPMRWLGERAYSIYLWNILARIAILNTLGRTTIGDIAWIAMFLVLAEASFRFVERPLRAKFARRPGVSSRPVPTTSEM